MVPKALHKTLRTEKILTIPKG